MRRLRTISVANLAQLDLAEMYVRQARDLLRAAGARKAYEAVRRVVKSVQGAKHHAQRSYYAGGGHG